MKRIMVLLASVCLFAALLVTPALAAEVPPLPHAFYGTVLINDSPADVGTQVEARGTGVTPGTTGNPITVTEAGKYGGPGGFDPRLVVQGFIEEGAIITFYVKGISTEQTAEWHSGYTTVLNLSVTIAAPPSGGGGGGGGAPTYYTQTNLFGIEARFRIDSDGKILQTIVATHENLTITIPAGTIALDKDGKRLESLEAAVDLSPPDLPENASIIGLAYDFGPDGATFDPPITLTWVYDPDALPEGVAEEDLVLAYYDEDAGYEDTGSEEDAGKWVELDCVIDTVNNTITASVSHFTTFAILAIAAPVIEPEPEPVIEPEPEPVIEPEPEPVIEPEPEPTPAPPAPAPEPEPTNWPLIGGIIAAAIVVALLIFFLVRRRREV